MLELLGALPLRRVRDRERPDRERPPDRLCDRERRLLDSDLPLLLDELIFFLLDRRDRTRNTTRATAIATMAAAILRPKGRSEVDPLSLLVLLLLLVLELLLPPLELLLPSPT